MANNQQKGVSAESWHFLYEPVIDYLNGTKIYKDPVTVKPNLKLKKVLRVMTENGAHHVFILDEDKVKSVISISDVLHYFKNFAHLK